MPVQRIKYQLLVFLWILGSAMPVFSQNKEQDMLKQGNKFFYEENYAAATPFFLQLLSLNQTNPEYNYKYGTCLLYSDGEKSKPLKYLMFAVVKGSGLEKEVYYHAARALHLNYRFGEAIQYYNKYASMASEKEKEKYQVARQIEMCSNGKKLLRNITDLVVVSKKDYNESNFYQIYNPREIPGKIIVVEELQSAADKKKNHRIIVNFPKTSDIVYYSSYGDDGKSLDIYRVKKLPGNSWSKPQIVKGSVNTPYDENYPYMHPDGRSLYFCSKGHNSMGGYDVFRSILDPETETFGPPENMDFAINTPDDDILYILDSLEQSAHFASKRESGTGRIHVYNVRVERLPVLIAILKGRFVNEISPGSNGATITVQDMASNEAVGIFNAKSSNGDYLITLDRSGRYKFLVKCEGRPDVYEAVVDIPYQKEMRPLKQEIALVDKEGKETLVIRNMFDQNIEGADEIIAEVLKNKATLNPNADQVPDSLLQASKDKKNNTDVAEVAINENLTNDDLIKMAREQAENQQKEAEELRLKMEAAYNVAAQKTSEAREKAKEAENNINQGDEIIDPLEKGMFYDEAKRLNNEAEKSSAEAVIALNLAKNLEQQSKKAADDAAVSKKYADGIEKAISSKNKDEAIRQLKEQQAYIKSLMSSNAAEDDVYASTKKQAGEKKEEAQKAKATAEKYRNLEAGISNDIAQLKKERETAKDKRKAEIDDQLKQLEQDLAATQKKKQDAFDKAADLNREADMLDSQADMLAGILENPDVNPAQVLSQAEKDALSNNIQSQAQNIQGNNDKIEQKTQVDRQKKFDYNDFLAKYDYYANMFNEYERLKRSLFTPEDYDRLITHNQKWILEIENDLARVDRESSNATPEQKKQLDAKREQLRQLRQLKEQENKDLRVERQKLVDSLAGSKNTTTDKTSEKLLASDNASVKDAAQKNNDRIKAINDSNKTDVRKAADKNRANRELVETLDEQITKEKKLLEKAEGEEKVKAQNRLKVLEEAREQKEKEIAENNEVLQKNNNNVPVLKESVADEVVKNTSLRESNGINERVKRTRTLKEEIEDLSAQRSEATDDQTRTAIDRKIKEKSLALYQEEEKLSADVRKTNDNAYTGNENSTRQQLAETNLSDTDRQQVNSLLSEAEKNKTEAAGIFNQADKEKDPAKKNALLAEAVEKQNEAIEKQEQALDFIAEKGSKTGNNTATENLTPEQEKNLSASVDNNFADREKQLRESDLDETEKAKALKTLNEALADKIAKELDVLKNTDPAGLSETEKNKRLQRISDLEKLQEAKRSDIAALEKQIRSGTPADNTSTALTPEQEEQLVNSIDRDFSSREQEINNSSASPAEKAQALKTLNESMAEQVRKEIEKLQSEGTDGLSEEAIKARKIRIEELNRLLDAKQKRIAGLDRQIKNELAVSGNPSNAVLTSYTTNPAEYNNSTAQKEYTAVKKQLDAIQADIKAINELKTQRNATTDSRAQQKLDADITKKQEALAKKELEIAPVFEKINAAELAQLNERNNTLKTQLDPEKMSDEQEQKYERAIQLMRQAEQNTEQARDLRQQAGNAQNSTQRNELLKKAHVLENDAIRDRQEAEKMLAVLAADSSLANNNTPNDNGSNNNLDTDSPEDKNLITEVDANYNDRLNEIRSSNQSETRKTYQEHTLNKELVSELKNEIARLEQTDPEQLTEEEKRQRKMKIAELNRLLDAKQKALDASGQKLKDSNIAGAGDNNNDYSTTLLVQDAGARTEKQKIDGQLKDIKKDRELLAENRLKQSEVTDEKEKGRLEKEALSIENRINQKEIGIAPAVDRVNQLEFNARKNDLAQKQLRLAENNLSLPPADEQTVNAFVSQAENLNREADQLRLDAGKEKDATKKNELLRLAHEKETRAIELLRQAGLVIDAFRSQQNNADAVAGKADNERVISGIDPSYSEQVKEIEASNESVLRKTQRKENLNETLISKIKTEIGTLENDLSRQTPEEQARRKMRLAELNRLLDQKEKELRAQQQLLASNGISAGSTAVSYTDPYNVETPSARALQSEAAERINELKREEARLADLRLKLAEATVAADKTRLQNEVKNQEKTVTDKELNAAKVFADINQLEITNNREQLQKLQARIVDHRYVDKSSPGVLEAENNISAAGKKIEEATALRNQANRENDKNRKNELLKKAFALEKEALQLQHDAAGIYEALLGEAEVLAQRNGSNNSQNTGTNTNLAENPDDRPSARALKNYEQLNERATYLEQRYETVSDSAQTVKKKGRPGALALADRLKKDSEAARTEANLAKNNYEKLRQQEEEQSALLEQQKRDLENARQLAPEVARMNEYAGYYALQKEANNLREQVERNDKTENRLRDQHNAEKAEAFNLEQDASRENDAARKQAIMEKAARLNRLAEQHKTSADSIAALTRTLRQQYEDKQNKADSFLAGIDPVKAEKIRTVVGGNKNNLVQPEVTYAAENPANNNTVSDPVAFARNFRAPEEVKNDIFVKSNTAAYSSENPIPINTAPPKGIYFKVQVGAFRNPIPQDLFKEFVPITGETTDNGITRYTVGYFKEFKTADEAKKEIRGFGEQYKDAFVVGFQDGKRISVAEALRLLGEQPGLASNNNNGNNTNNNGNANNTGNNVNNNQGSNNSGNNASNQGNNNTGNPPVNNTPANVDVNNAGREYNEFVADDRKASYYDASAAKANQVEVIKGLFYTVQVGVYSRPVSLDKIYNVQPLNSELTKTNKIRYTTGIFTDIQAATRRRDEVRPRITDAFVTAYFNGKRITMEEARQLVEKYGREIYANPTNLKSGSGNRINASGNNTNGNSGNTGNNNSGNNSNGTNNTGNGNNTGSNNNGTNNGNTGNNNSNGTNNNTGNSNNGTNNGNTGNTGSNENTSTAYSVILGEYTGDIPSKDAEVLIKNSGQYRIMKTERNGKATYFVSTRDKNEADQVNAYFRSQGLSQTSIINNQLTGELAGNNNAKALEPKKQNGLKFQVYLGEYVDEVPEDDALIYLNNVDKGVKRKTNTEGYTIYYTCDCESYDDALRSKAYFVQEGITSIRIVPFLNEKEISMAEAFRLIYE